jgi:hypothetical protein
MENWIYLPYGEHTTMRQKLMSLASGLALTSAMGICFAQGAVINEADLRAAFCLPILKDAYDVAASLKDVKSGPQEIGQELFKITELRYTRVQKYLLARSHSIESAQLGELIAAMEAGKAASKAAMELGRPCFEDGSSGEVRDKCLEKQIGKTEWIRIKGCHNVDYLPY